MYNSSPNLYTNTSYCTDGSASGLYQALSANYYSSPLMRPTSTWLGLLDDAGYNDLQNTYNQGIGIYLSDHSQPVLDYGFGTIYGSNYHISGWIEEACAFPF